MIAVNFVVTVYGSAAMLLLLVIFVVYMKRIGRRQRFEVTILASMIVKYLVLMLIQLFPAIV